MTDLATKIISLRNQGKSYRDIVRLLGCSKGTVSFHLGPGQKEKTLLATRRHRAKCHPYLIKLRAYCNLGRLRPNKTSFSSQKYQVLLYRKLHHFHNPHRKHYIMSTKPQFTVDDVISKFGEQPVCYLTGQPIDITKPSTYAFDHMIPTSRGGDNSLDNLNICTRLVNLAKTDMTPDEFINLCKRVLEHNGYSVKK